MEEDYEQVIVVALFRIFGVCGNVQLMSLANRNIFVVNSISRADLRPFLVIPPCQSRVFPKENALDAHHPEGRGKLSHSVEGNGKGAALELALGFASMVNYGLVVL